MNNINTQEKSCLRNYAIRLEFNKKELTGEEALGYAKVLLNSLRGMAQRHNWYYRAIAIIPDIKHETNQQNNIQVYIVLTALPSGTVKDWVYQYWFNKLGCVECNPIDNPKEFIKRMRDLNSKIIEHTRKHKHFNGEFY